ncbi:hypothetical protein QCA50_013595 [Cerrena zonata]|uniref:Carbohydrate-binding module family 19 domain-containing protein n=1 Tax=Cerrena zonata TaxID=2478898 RepID=A0AAW0FNR7_9APHY
MVQLALKCSALLAFVLLAQGAPVYKRISQNTPDAKTAWEAACNAAGGAEKCNPIAVNAIGTLLAAADPCAQQNSADQMIDLAKQLNNDPNMIKLAQIFAQQPRNSPDSLSVPYCQQAPKNQELNGLFQCQFQGVNPKSFFKNTPVGQAGTIPLGQNKPLDPAGSCPAHPDGPIPDGQQLVDIVGGAAGAGNSNNGSGNASVSAPSASSSAADATGTDSASSTTVSAPAATAAPPSTATATVSDDPSADPTDDCSDDPTATEAPSAAMTVPATASATEVSVAGAAAASATTDATAPTATTGSGSSGDFHAQNAKDAQALNVKFASLTKDSSCNEGDEACIDGGFAQCVGGKFVNMGCGPSTQCFALPLVNKPGTTITCDTPAGANAKITASGGQGDVTGKGN